MCKKWTVAYGDYIGKRLVSWCAFNGKDFSFLSDKQVGARLRLGELVNGLTLDSEKNVVIDETFAQNLLGKSGRSFVPIASTKYEHDDLSANKYYALVKVEQGKSGKLYHFITNRCGHEYFDEVQLKSMLGILNMGGVHLDKKGRLVVHKAVDMVPAMGEQNETPAGSSEKQEGAK